MDPITVSLVAVGAVTKHVTPSIVKGAINVVDKIKDCDCNLGISGGISLLTGTPDVTIGVNCSGKDKS